MALCPQAGGLAVASEGLILQPHLSVCSLGDTATLRPRPFPDHREKLQKGWVPGAK